MRVRNALAAMSLGACVLLAACGGGNDDPAPEVTPTVAPTAAPTEPVAGPLEIADAVWATGIDSADGSPADSIEWLPTDATAVYAVFETGPIAAGTAFDVSWTMNGVPVSGLNPSLQIRADTPAGWVEFHLDRTSEQRWPSGTLAIELSVNGEIVAAGTIELRG